MSTPSAPGVPASMVTRAAAAVAVAVPGLTAAAGAVVPTGLGVLDAVVSVGLLLAALAPGLDPARRRVVRGAGALALVVALPGLVAGPPTGSVLLLLGLAAAGCALPLWRGVPPAVSAGAAALAVTARLADGHPVAAWLGPLLWAVAVLATLAGSTRDSLTGIAAARSTGPSGGRPRWARTAAIVAVLAGLLALVLPQLHPPGGGGAGGGSGTGLEGAQSSAAARVRLAGGPLDLRARGALDPTPQLLLVDRDGGAGPWRAVTFDAYDGTTWEPLPSTRRLGSATGGLGLADASAGSRVDTVQANVLAPTSLLVSAERPTSVRAPADLVGDGEGGLSSFRELPRGTDYVVQSVLTPAAPVAGGPTSLADRPRWLQLPAELPQRVRDLAASWTTGAADDAARVATIEARLRAGYTYTLRSPVPRGDAVDDLLFTSRRGFCEQFASAAAVMLRSLGVPARVVGGYAAGQPTGDGGSLITGSAAHAWVEWWAPGRGWVTTDPTAGVPLAPDPPARSPLSSLLHWLRAHLLALVAGALGVLPLAGVVLIVRRRRRRPPPVSVTDSGLVGAAYREVELAAARAGLPPRGPGETATELLARLPVPVGPGSVGALQAEAFGRGVPVEDREQAARELVAAAAALAPPT